VAYFMVSVDDAETNKKFATEHEADYPILSDPEKTAANAFGVLGATGLARRWTFYIGGDGKILSIDKAVRTGTAGEDLAAKLSELADKGLIKRKK
jgi:thioredoxin-dependent peroxiredoxin